MGKFLLLIILVAASPGAGFAQKGSKAVRAKGIAVAFFDAARLCLICTAQEAPDIERCPVRYGLCMCCSRVFPSTYIGLSEIVAPASLIRSGIPRGQRTPTACDPRALLFRHHRRGFLFSQ